MPHRLHPSTASGLLLSHLLVAGLLLLLIPTERALPYYGAIQAAATPWAVDLAADPRYAARVALMILNGAGLVASVGLTVMMGRLALRQQAPAWMVLLSGSLLWLVSAKAVLLAPYWINGVASALVQVPASDMDPKALIPAIGIPFWQPLTFTLTLFLMLSVPLLEGAALWHTVRSRRWHSIVAIQLPLALAWWLFRLAPTLGPWLAD